MDAIKFIRERNRMCATYTPKRCEGCPADNYGERDAACIMVDKIDAERLVPIVEEWSAAHPRKTRQSVFIQQYPEVTFNYGIINIKPCQMVQNYTYRDCNITDCPQCRKEFWMQEVE